MSRRTFPLKTPDRDEDVGPTFVYFCQGVYGGPIKIGVARHPRTRLREMQVGSPVRLRMIAIAEGGVGYESFLHARFSAWRLHGEWFDEHADGLAEVIHDAQDELRRRAACNPPVTSTHNPPYPTQPSRTDDDSSEPRDNLYLSVHPCAIEAPLVDIDSGIFRRANPSAYHELAAAQPPEPTLRALELQRWLAEREETA